MKRTIEDFKITTDEDTTILRRKLIDVADYQAIFETWIWDGIKAKSLIFVSEDVKDLTDKQLVAVLNSYKPSYSVGQTTIKRQEDYTFINFGFTY